MKRKKNICV